MRKIHLCSVLTTCALAGCIPDQAAQLFNGVYSGQSSYAATIDGTGQGLAGAAPMTASANGDESLELGGGCILEFSDIDLATDSRGQGTSATAMLSGSGCAVPVDGGAAMFNVTSGSATSTGGTSLMVSVGGELVSWVGAPAMGYATVMFQGVLAND